MGWFLWAHSWKESGVSKSVAVRFTRTTSVNCEGDKETTLIARCPDCGSTAEVIYRGPRSEEDAVRILKTYCQCLKGRQIQKENRR